MSWHQKYLARSLLRQRGMDTRRTRPCLLLVEDHDDFRETLSEVLKMKGYVVACAEDGIQAIDIMKSKDGLPDLVITDLRMPYDGGSLRDAMLKDDELATVPVIVLSATPPEATDARLQAVAYFQKPVPLDKLLRAVDEHCDMPSPPHRRR